MMHQQVNKKIFLYILLFLIVATFNNRNLNDIDLIKVDKILIEGLDEKKNSQLVDRLNFLREQNIFFLDNIKIKETIESSNLVEKYSVFKLYPSSLNISIIKTNFLAYTKKDGNYYLLGSNGKLIKTSELNQNLPLIFGDFKIKNFFELKDAMNEVNFEFKDVKNLFFFKSGRWDIETQYGLLIKLPKKEIKRSLQIFLDFIEVNDLSEIKEIDLRQHNQIIING